MICIKQGDLLVETSADRVPLLLGRLPLLCTLDWYIPPLDFLDVPPGHSCLLRLMASVSTVLGHVMWPLLTWVDEPVADKDTPPAPKSTSSEGNVASLAWDSPPADVPLVVARDVERALEVPPLESGFEVDELSREDKVAVEWTACARRWSTQLWLRVLVRNALAIM